MLTPAKYVSTQCNSHPATSLGTTLANRPNKARRTEVVSQTSTFACLVVSGDPLRQLMFGQTAERTGWRPIVCADAAAALKHLSSMVIGAALVDIATPAEQGAMNMRQLVEHLAHSKEVLTVVCGRTNDRLAEIWARELGVWAHLPGVAPESDLDSLLRAARQVVERIHRRHTSEGLVPTGSMHST
jgi:DNA-binding NtrC family response regulator